MKSTAEWEPYLKEDETPLERFLRERADNQALMGLLAKEKAENESLRRDAARYRWIVAHLNDDTDVLNDTLTDAFDELAKACQGAAPPIDMFNKAIDAAILKETTK